MPSRLSADDRRRMHVERMLARARKRSRQALKIVSKWEAKLEELNREGVRMTQPRLCQEEHLHSTEEAQLVASDALKMPEETMDWTGFSLAPAGKVSREIAIEVALESRGDR